MKFVSQHDSQRDLDWYMPKEMIHLRNVETHLGKQAGINKKSW